MATHDEMKEALEAGMEAGTAAGLQAMAPVLGPQIVLATAQASEAFLQAAKHALDLSRGAAHDEKLRLERLAEAYISRAERLLKLPSRELPAPL